MKKIRLSRQEKRIEDALIAGEYGKMGPQDFERVAHSIQARKKDAILHVRVNHEDLRHIKQKAKRLGVKYQTFISEVLHNLALG